MPKGKNMKPIYKIVADEKDITEKIQDRLISLNITDEYGLVSDTVSIELDDRGNELNIPVRGACLEVFIGYDSKQLYSMGKFIVDEIEISGLPCKMTITGRASNSALEIAELKAPRNKSWKEISLENLIKTIAKKHGLTCNIDNLFKDYFIKHIDQTDESDIAFLQRLSKDYNAVVKINGGKILLINFATGKFPDGTDLPTIKIPYSDLSNYRMRISERGKYKKVVAKYYDYAEAKEKKIEVGEGSPAFSLRGVFATKEQAKLRAEGKLKETQQGIYTFTSDVIGNPLISAESKIEIEDMPRAELKNAWIIKRANHILNNSGFKTSIEGIRPITQE